MTASIGIDFGTSTTELAICTSKGVAVAADPRGDAVIDSVVAYLPNGETLFGNAAKKRSLVDPTNTLHSFKRIIGLPWLAREVQEFADGFPFILTEDIDAMPRFETRVGAVLAAEVAAHLFDYLRGSPTLRSAAIENAVVTVPTSFRKEQSVAIHAAVRAAGFPRVGIIEEAYVAALPYLDGRPVERHVVVYDLGGGTFDVAVLRIKGLANRMLASAGDPYLGGCDIDRRLADLVAEEMLREHRHDMRSELVTFNRLVVACEKAKIELSTKDATTIPLGMVHPGLVGRAHTVRRSDLQGTINDLTRRTFVILDEVLKAADIPARRVDAVVLAGGSTRIPSIREALHSYFGIAPLASHPPDRVVAVGASLAAALLAGNRDALSLQGNRITS